MRDYYLQYAKLPVFKRRVAEAMQIVAEAKKIGNFYVSFSGGKDSTVVAALVGKSDMIYGDDEFLLSETETYLSKFPNLKRQKLKTFHDDFFTANAEDNTEDFRDAYNLCFIGLRAEEDKVRRMNLKMRGKLYQLKSGKWMCQPIADWKIEDVWAYIYSFGIEYNTAYDIMRQKGMAEKDQRIGPFANFRASQFGCISRLRMCFPDDFDKFAKKYPEATKYV